MEKTKRKTEIAFHERGFKSKIINQILNAIIEVKIYNKESYIIKNYEFIKKEFQSKMFLDVISKIPKYLLNFYSFFSLCDNIFELKLGYNVEAIIAFVALYFFAALRVYPLLIVYVSKYGTYMVRYQ